MSDEKFRVQFEVPEYVLKEIDDLKGMIGVSSRKEVFTNAIAILEWCAYQVENGKSIAAIDDQEECKLYMPILNNITKRIASHANS